jgi:putative transposase
MSDYRRCRIPGGTYFFTVVTHQRRPLFHDRTLQRLLGESIRECMRDWPFSINAIVLLPDHLHAIWTLPPGDDQYPGRWSVIKKGFTERFRDAGGQELPVTRSQADEGRAGIWQRRYWEHTIEDNGDFDIRFDYIHYNAVKHGYVKCPKEWPPSSFHRWVRQGVYDRDWACGKYPPPNFSRIENQCGEPIGW